MIEASRGTLGWLLIIALGLTLAAALLVGSVVGCQASLKRNNRISADRARYQAQEAFYQLCKRRTLAGVLPLPRRCPR